MTTPSVSVVIPCLNEAAYLEVLLDGLRGQDFTAFEIIIVDGGSSDGSVNLVHDYLRRHPHLRLRLLHNSRRSIPSSLNLGIAAAAGVVIVRLDGHSQPSPSYIRNCLAALERSGAEVVGGAWEIRPGAETVVARAIAIAVSSRLAAGDAAYRLNSEISGDVDTVPFGCFRRDTWASVGNFDETLLSNEDYEFNWRVRQQGGRVYYDPSIRSGYFAQPTLRTLFIQYQRYGWWKGRMLRHHPTSIRLRQATPMIWLAVLALLHLAGLAWPPATLALAGVWLTYLATLIGWSAWLTIKRGLPFQGMAALVIAFVLIHITWSSSAWAGLAAPAKKSS